MSYIGQIPLPQATEERIERTATAGQTSFTGLTYVNGHISVYLNGVKLDNADFTATDGTTVTLGTGAAAGDTVSFVSTTQTSALVALPLKDSAGNSVLSESGGVVTLGNATLASSVIFPTYPSGSFFEANFYESQSSDAISEIWYRVPTECTLVAFEISAFHSVSHTAIAHVYTSTAAGSQTTEVYYRAVSSLSGWATWLTSDGSGSLVSGPVNLGGTSEHNFVGVRTTSSQSHGYWNKVTTTLRFKID